MNRANAISEDNRFRLLHLIEENPKTSQREIATARGVSLGGVNYSLRASIGKGFLKVRNVRQSGNKVAYLYLLTPKGIAEKTRLTEAFLRRGMAEFGALREEIEAVRASGMNRYQYPRNPPASRSTAVQTLPETGRCCCRGA